MNKQDTAALAVRGGLEAMRTIALAKLAIKALGRLGIVYTKCRSPCSIDDIVMRKVPGKLVL